MSEWLGVLVVDDEQVVREHFSKHIPWKENGFALTGTAQNGREAIAMMERELPDLVLTDITMPVMDGMEFAAYVRERWPEVKLIFLTAHDEFAYARQAIVLGAKNYLLKIGLTKEQIMEACKEAVADWMKDAPTHLEGESRPQESLSNDWPLRRHLLQMALVDRGEAEAERIAALFSEWVEMEGSNYVVLSLSWDCFPAGKLSLQELEALLEKQLRFAEAAEKLAHELDIQAAVFPGRAARLVVIATCPVKLGASGFQSRVQKYVSGINSISEAEINVRCSLHLSELSSGKDRLIALLQEGQSRLLDSFYSAPHESSSGNVKFLETSRADILETAASITCALREGEAEKLDDWLDRLPATHRQAYSPQFLLDVAQWVADHGLTSSSAAGRALKLSLELVCNLDQYIKWWERLKECMLLPQFGTGGKEVRREIRLVRQYVSQHYHTPLQMSDVAEAVQLNPAYLGQMFRQETGEYLSDYINRIRIHKAKELLEGTNMKIYEVAQAVGLTDYRYFCKMFKKWIGHTPTQYKKSV